MNGFGLGRVRTVPERLTLVPATVAAWSALKPFDPDFATWVKAPELVFTRAIWITTVVLDEGLNIVRGAEQGHQHKALYSIV